MTENRQNIICVSKAPWFKFYTTLQNYLTVIVAKLCFVRKQREGEGCSQARTAETRPFLLLLFGPGNEA